MATKMRMDLLNNRKKCNILGALHNSMTKFCSALFKCVNKLKVGRENQCTFLKCTQMRARVEKLDVLGLNKSCVS